MLLAAAAETKDVNLATMRTVTALALVGVSLCMYRWWCESGR